MTTGTPVSDLASLFIGSRVDDFTIGPWIINNQTLPAARAITNKTTLEGAFSNVDGANNIMPLIGWNYGEQQPAGLVQAMAHVYHATDAASKSINFRIFGSANMHRPSGGAVLDHPVINLMNGTITTPASPNHTEIQGALSDAMKGVLSGGGEASGKIVEGVWTVSANTLPSDAQPRVWGSPNILEFDARGLRYLWVAVECPADTQVRFITKQL